MRALKASNSFAGVLSVINVVLNALWYLTSKFIERDDVKNLLTYTIPESLVRLAIKERVTP